MSQTKTNSTEFNRKAFIPHSTSTWLTSQLLSFPVLLLTFSCRGLAAQTSKRNIHNRPIQSHSGLFKCTFKRLRVVLTGFNILTAKQHHKQKNTPIWTRPHLNSWRQNIYKTRLFKVLFLSTWGEKTQAPSWAPRQFTHSHPKPKVLDDQSVTLLTFKAEKKEINKHHQRGGSPLSRT